MDNLASLNFLNFVAELTEKAGIAPQNVVLEVTETRLMQDTRAPLEILDPAAPEALQALDRRFRHRPFFIGPVARYSI